MQELVPSWPINIKISCPFSKFITVRTTAPLEEPIAELPLPPAAPANIKLKITTISISFHCIKGVSYV